MASSAPPGCDSLIATIGTVSAAAISIGTSSFCWTRVLRSSIPVLIRSSSTRPLLGLFKVVRYTNYLS